MTEDGLRYQTPQRCADPDAEFPAAAERGAGNPIVRRDPAAGRHAGTRLSVSSSASRICGPSLWRGELWCSACVRELTPEGWCEQVLARIDTSGADSYRLTDWRVLRPEGPRVHEKNWMPQVVGDKLQFVYLCDPTRLVDERARTIAETHAVDRGPSIPRWLAGHRLRRRLARLDSRGAVEGRHGAALLSASLRLVRSRRARCAASAASSTSTARGSSSPPDWRGIPTASGC